MSGEEQNVARNWIRRIEYALLAGGLLLLAFWGAARLQSFLNSRAALRTFEAHETAASPSANPIGGEPGSGVSFGVDFSRWDQGRVQAYRESLTQDWASTPLAVLRIPKINLEVPVFDGTDSLTLNRAVGRISGTARPGEEGNMGLAGHRDGFFRALKDVSVGDTVELESRKGMARYVVDEVRIVDPKDVSVLKSRSTPSLTLVTCHPFYFVGSAPERYIVSASLAQEDDRNAGQSVVPINPVGQFEKEKQ